MWLLQGSVQLAVVSHTFWYQHSKVPDATINLVGILESDPQGEFARPWFETRPELFYENVEKLLADSQVNVIVETIGGSGFARELITKALKKGKHVVTANKDLIAVHGEELDGNRAEKTDVICFLKRLWLEQFRFCGY